MDKRLQDYYADRKVDSAYAYIDKKGKDIRLAVLKANDLYNVISESIIELLYAEKEYYINKKTTKEVTNLNLNENFVRYIHIKNAINSINSIYDISLQIPWFLYRIWTKNNQIKRNELDWIDKVEELCNKKSVMLYLKSNNRKLYKLLKEFSNNYIWNAKKKFTVRTLCNNIKHKGTIQPTEIINITEDIKFNIEIENKDSQLLEGDKELRLFNKCGVPEIKITNNKRFNVDILYNKNGKVNENFYGKDLYRNEYSIDEIYKECIDYLISFKPIYDEYISMLNKDLKRLIKPAEVRNKSEFNLDRYFTQG